MDKVLGVGIDAVREIAYQDARFDREGLAKLALNFQHAVRHHRPAVVRNNYGQKVLEFKFPPDSGIIEPDSFEEDIFSSVPPKIFVVDEMLYSGEQSKSQYLNQLERTLRVADQLAFAYHLTAIDRSILSFSWQHYAKDFRELKVVGLAVDSAA